MPMVLLETLAEMVQAREVPVVLPGDYLVPAGEAKWVETVVLAAVPGPVVGVLAVTRLTA